MRTCATMLVVASLVVSLSACTTRGSPRRDRTTPSGYYIPQDLDDALRELDRIMGKRGHDEVMRTTEDDMIYYHHGLGTWMRNNWGLRAGSRLAEYFYELGIRHPDDMSGIIFASYWRSLHDKQIDLEGQLRYYEEFWKAAKAIPDG